MLSLRELSFALFGVWRLAHLDPRGLAFFDLSESGARRSFSAAALMAPLYGLTLFVAFHRRGTDAEAVRAAVDPLRYTIVEAIAYSMSWTAYPVILEWLSRRLGCRARFVAYLTIYNWSMVLQNSVVLLFSLLVLSRIVPADAAQLLWMVLFGFVLAFLWFLARIGLAVSALNAAGLVMLDVLTSALIDNVASALY